MYSGDVYETRVCVMVDSICVQLSEGGGAGRAAGWQSCALHLERAHRVPAALLDVWYFQRKAED